MFRVPILTVLALLLTAALASANERFVIRGRFSAPRAHRAAAPAVVINNTVSAPAPAAPPAAPLAAPAPAYYRQPALAAPVDPCTGLTASQAAALRAARLRAMGY